ncbi:hypothetical protein LU11_gp078 [Pseudomonas phage Lu11]|uniref:hypothetical protein n=1 Tax=Pseudomonas phage Lu11 TaxID=1161927 RepID=UPI00025F1528|nr:hypothetical protein LU11_gp078 [Pseudomonas phage Lu11]AFH14609.1 hypothetical protein Lu11_0077 [Pseudomonas phage Lu11]
MIISLAAAAADFKQFEWMYNAGKSFKLDLDGTPVTVDPDDLIGFRKATRGPTTGAYQVVLAKYPQKVYRAIKEETIKEFIHQFKDYTGTPDKPKKEGQRYSPMRKAKLANDKLESQFWVAPKSPRETDSYDRADYQWRRVMRTTPVYTKTHKASRKPLHEGDVIGMRYSRKSHGGYLILPTEERINISHDLYETITNNSDIQHAAQQQKGIVTFADIDSKVERPSRRIRIPKKYNVEKEHVGKTSDGTSDSDHAARIKPLVSTYDYVDMDEEFDFEDEEEEELLNPTPDVEDEELEYYDDNTVNNEEEDDEIEDDPEMDYHKDQEVDEEGEIVDDPESVMAHEGLVLTTKKGDEWVVVSIEENGLTDILLLYNEESKALRHYNVPAMEDLRNMKSVTPGRTLVGEELDKVMTKAADLEMSAGKRL